MLTAKGRADAIRQLIGREHSIGFNHPPFAMRPFGLNGVEPGALDWQTTGQDAHAMAIVLHLAIVFSNPGAHLIANVPGSIIPDQSQDTFIHRFQLGTTPFKKLDRDIADRTSIHETHQDFLVRLSVFLFPPQQQPITGQGFGVRVVFGFRLFNQAQWLVRVAPRRQVGLGKTAPPHFIAETLHPIWIRFAQTNQPIPSVFFRSYPGSGLMIHCLARFHFTPRRSSVWRMVSSLNSSGSQTLFEAHFSRQFQGPQAAGLVIFPWASM